MSGRRAQSLAVHLVLAGGAALTLAPLLWMVAASFMPTGQASVFPPRLLPDPPVADHYRALFARLHLARAFANSAAVAVIATALSVLINGMAGFAFAKLRFTGRDRIFRLLLVGLVIPVQVGMLPLFLLFKSLGLANTLAAVVIPSTATIFGIFMVRQYALGIPDDLLDAARIDGASEARIFASIALPQLRPILVTLAVFTFLSTWNDFLWPLVVLSDDRRYTLPVALASLSGEHVQDTELMMAGAVLTVIPALVVFAILQRQYVRGLLAGGVKG
ncbi:MAG TPA: carbohydrate ABC transporter permease [Candidatus Eisenbacteria bacterium]|jgi:multiple sugar transport system permease protein